MNGRRSSPESKAAVVEVRRGAALRRIELRRSSPVAERHGIGTEQ